MNSVTPMNLYYPTDNEIDILMEIANKAATSPLIDGDLLDFNVQNLITDEPRLSIKQLKWWKMVARKIRYDNISFLSIAINTERV